MNESLPTTRETVMIAMKSEFPGTIVVPDEPVIFALHLGLSDSDQRFIDIWSSNSETRIDALAKIKVAILGGHDAKDSLKFSDWPYAYRMFVMRHIDELAGMVKGCLEVLPSDDSLPEKTWSFSKVRGSFTFEVMARSEFDENVSLVSSL